MSIRNNTWLIQRLSKPRGFINPWGDVNNGVKDVNIKDVVSPDYMGAAEYEWGTYSKCIEIMQKYGTKLSIISLYPENTTGRYSASIPIYIVSSKGCEPSEVIEEIRHLYFKPSLELHETGLLPEISKSDYSSFYKECRKVAVCKFNDIRTHGWLNVKKYYSFFIESELAESFNQYFNQVKES